MLQQQNYSDRLQMLMHTQLIDNGLTYAEHKKHCKTGCILCSAFRKYEKQLKSEISDTEAKELGLSREQILSYRASLDHTRIEDYYPDKSAALNPDGSLSRDAYLVLQLEDFHDREIREHFGFNVHQWNIYKAKEFPNWKNRSVKEKLLSSEGVAAYNRWRSSGENRLVRVRH